MKLQKCHQIKPYKSFHEHKRQLEKCYRRGEKYSFGHQCNQKGIRMIKGNDGDEKEFVEAKEWGNNGINIEEEGIKECDLSLNVLAESYTHNTIEIKGSYYGRDSVILIDC